MQRAYNLLIIYNDGTEKVVKNINYHEFSEKSNSFCYEKNGYRSFVPAQAVRFFGREFDYLN